MLLRLRVLFRGLSLVGKLSVYTVAAIIGGSLLTAIAHPSTSTDIKQEDATAGINEISKNAEPIIEVKAETVTEAVPFEKETINDNLLDIGKTVIKTSGVEGLRTLIYSVTYTDGKETDRILKSQETTKEPITEITAIGTKEPAVADGTGDNDDGDADCDPNYSGACVPIASDVDCAGGSGNGPAYVQGPVTVIGRDIYDLDRDNDGIGCE